MDLLHEIVFVAAKPRSRSHTAIQMQAKVRDGYKWPFAEPYRSAAGDSAIPGQWIISHSTPLNPVSDIPITVLGCQQNGTIHKDLQQHAAPVDKNLSTIQISLLLPSSPINPGWERYGSSFCPPEAMLLPNKTPKRTSKLKQSAAIPNHILRAFPTVVNCKENQSKASNFKVEAFDRGLFVRTLLHILTVQNNTKRLIHSHLHILNCHYFPGHGCA